MIDYYHDSDPALLEKEESWQITEKAKKMPAFSYIEDISAYCPPESLQRERIPYIEQIRRNLERSVGETPISEADIRKLVEQLERLDMNVYELSQMAFIGGQDKVDMMCRSIIGDPESETPSHLILGLIERIQRNPGKAVKGLNLFQKLYMPRLRAKLHDMANPELITLETLPEAIKNRFLNEKGDRFLVTIFARQQVWNLEFLRLFTDQLMHVSERATGFPPVFLRLIDYVARDGLRATVLTVLVVFLLLWFDFRSFRMALIGLIPLVAGGIWMVGLLKSIGMMLTIVNVMGIPMIVGIAIDDGVHLLHRYRVEGFNRSREVLKGTGKAILLTSLTTMVGFGSLMIAKYRGFISLGALLVLGVGACLVTTVLFLPPIVSLWRRRA